MSQQQWNSLNSPDILGTLTSNLPGNARDKWNRKVLSIRRHRAEDPELADFIDFINDEILLASDPLFSREALKVYVEKEERSHLKKKMKSYASNTTDKVQEEKDAIKEMKCPVCEEKHDLDNCKQFSSMSVDERSKMLRKKKIMLWVLPSSVSRAYCQDLQEKESLQNLCNEASNWIAWLCTKMESWRSS